MQLLAGIHQYNKYPYTKLNQTLWLRCKPSFCIYKIHGSLFINEQSLSLPLYLSSSPVLYICILFKSFHFFIFSPFYVYSSILCPPQPSRRKHRKGRITVMSSLHEIYMGQLVNRVVVRGRKPYSALLQPFQQPASGQKFKDEMNGFSSTSAIFSTKKHRREKHKPIW